MTKQQILEATLDLACEKGLGSISMSQIAEKVGLKKSSLYSHFRSKEEIIRSMYEYFRSLVKTERGIADTDYTDQFTGSSLYAILAGSVDRYRKMNSSSNLEQFYRMIMSERVYDPAASSIIVEETKRMIQATKHLFYALTAKKIVLFEDPDAAAFCFAMGVHAVMEFEYDAAASGSKDADTAMDTYIREFCRIYETERERRI